VNYGEILLKKIKANPYDPVFLRTTARRSLMTGRLKSQPHSRKCNMTDESPTPKLPLPWIVNPHYGESLDPPPVFVGDRMLIAVPLAKKSWSIFVYDIQVIVAAEVGFDLNGESWSDWSWWDVSHYIPLDGARTQQDLENLE